MNVTATELETHFEHYLDACIKQPVFIENSDSQCVMLISFAEYEKFTALAELLKMAEEKGVILELPLP